MFENIGTDFLNDLEKVSTYKKNNIHVTSSQVNGKRLTQQDRYMILNSHYGYLAVVCDGHGDDSSAADTVVINIAKVLSENYQKAYKEFGRDISAISDKKVISQIFSSLHKLTSSLKSGTTVSLVMIRLLGVDEENKQQMRATFATLGDSPLSLFDKGVYTHMPVHSAEYYYKDRVRIEESNAGYFEGGYLFSFQLHPREGGIAMTRALGKKDFYNVLFRQPSILSMDITPDSVIALASDGILTSVASNDIEKEMESLLQKVKEGESAKNIQNSIGNPDDNATLITVSFEELEI